MDPLHTIFLQARGIADVAGRAAYLDQACAGDAELRSRVELLLADKTAADDWFGDAETVDDPAAGGARPLAAAAEPPMPEQIGPYRILECIGQGGMGNVYRAEQRRPIRREVALKLVKLGLDTRQVMLRFEAERQALALMNHPNIARVYDAGADERGRPYFVMELVRGEPITRYADRHLLPLKERLILLQQVCHAIQHAHSKGIIHRDLKPGNVLVSTQDGRPFAKVIDFGIAKATASQLTDGTLFTEFHHFIGTPQYMSPEQAEGSLDIDTRSDVYSLGVLLYELLTGYTPFDAEMLKKAALGEIARIIREEEPPKPSTRLGTLAAARGAVTTSATLDTLAKSRALAPEQLVKQVRGELDWLVMKSLEKDRSRRYETPSSLAEDISRYLDGLPVKAAPPGTMYRLNKFVRKRKGPVIAGAVAFVALSVGAAGLVIGFYRANWNAEQARMAKNEALERKDDAEWEAYVGNLAAAHACLLTDDYRTARIRLEACPIHLRRWEWRFLNELALSVITALPGESYDWMTYRHDGRMILAGKADSKIGESVVRLLDSEGLLTGVEIIAKGAVAHGGFSPDGSVIFLLVWNHGLKFFDLQGNEISGISEKVGNLLLHPDGKRIFTWNDQAELKLWDYSGNLIKSKSGTWLGQSSGFLISPAGDLLGVSWEPGKLCMMKPDLESAGVSINAASEGVFFFSPDGGLVAATEDAPRDPAKPHVLNIWDRNGGLRGKITEQRKISSGWFLPDGRRVAVVCEDSFTIKESGSVRVWDADGTSSSLTMPCGPNAVPILRGEGVAVSSIEGVRFYNLEGNLLGTFGRLNGQDASREIVASPDGDRLLVEPHYYDSSTKIVMLDARRFGTPIKSIKERVDLEVGAILEKDGEFPAATENADGSANRMLEQIGAIASNSSDELSSAITRKGVKGVALLPADGRLVVAMADKVGFYDLTSGRLVCQIRTYMNLTGMSLSGVGSLVLRSSDGMARIWDPRPFTERKKDALRRADQVRRVQGKVRSLLLSEIPSPQISSVILDEPGASALEKCAALDLLEAELAKLRSEATERVREFARVSATREQLLNLVKQQPGLGRLNRCVIEAAEEFEFTDSHVCWVIWHELVKNRQHPERVLADYAKVLQSMMSTEGAYYKIRYEPGALIYLRQGRYAEALSLVREDRNSRDWSERDDCLEFRWGLYALLSAKVGNVDDAEDALRVVKTLSAQAGHEDEWRAGWLNPFVREIEEALAEAKGGKKEEER